MADSAVAITAGAGTSIDTRTEATNGNHRQVVVLGDPSTNAGVAPVDATKGLTINPAGASTATLANVPASASSVTLQAANSARMGLIIVNDSTVNLYVKYGTTATSSSYTHLLQAGEERSIPLYTGIVTGIWASATGNARVTELTA